MFVRLITTSHATMLLVPIDPPAIARQGECGIAERFLFTRTCPLNEDMFCRSTLMFFGQAL